MKDLHVFFRRTTIAYLLVVLMVGVESWSWAKEHFFHIALFLGMLISLDATNSLTQVRQRSSK